MKKLLGMAGALGVFVATTANVVACGETPKENNDDNKEENVAIFDIDRIYARNGTHLEIDLNKYTLLAQ
jgi:co-chaperonin GroES (HSP10)